MPDFQKKKILYLVTLSELGGAQRYVRDLATRLPAGEFSVAVAAGGEGPLLSELAQSGVTVFPIAHLVREIAPFKDWTASREIRRVIKRWQPDVLHVNSSKAGVLGTISARATPATRVIYTAHGFVFNEPLPKWRRKVYRIAERRTARGKDVLICVSQADRQSALHWNIAPTEKLTTIHNGIDPSAIRFYPVQKAREILAQHAKPRSLNSKLLVGTIANLYPTKGIRDFIAAAAMVVQKIPGTTFIVIGEGSERPALESLIHRYGLNDTFHLLGAIPDAARLLPAFEVYVNASHKEGFPYSLLEAMAAQRPIAATAVGGVPEMLRDGNEGLLVPPGQPVALNNAIVQLLQNRAQAQTFGHAAGQRVGHEFTLSQMIEKTAACYRRVLERTQ
ncbi:MAG: glycosyltransferase family 4 protein [Patescibacteria group bacterium]|nr:glycosyltransferase family 4 protein [Patescibacteria group bacterium]